MERPKWSLLQKTTGRAAAQQVVNRFLRKVGLTRKQVFGVVKLLAEGLSPSAVSIKLAVRQEKIKPLLRLIKRSRVRKINLVGEFFESNADRVALVLTVEPLGASMADLARLLSSSRTVVGSASRRVNACYGFASPSPNSANFRRLRDAAQKVGLPVRTVGRLCSEGLIPCVYRAGVAYLEPRGLRELEEWLKARARPASCSVCGIPQTEKGRRKLDGRYLCAKCFKEEERVRSRTRYARQKKSGIFVVCHTGWRKKLSRKIKTVVRPKREEWLEPHASARFTTLTKMQLLWLAMCKTIRVKVHPNRRSHKRPTRRYAKSELELILELCDSK